MLPVSQSQTEGPGPQVRGQEGGTTVTVQSQGSHLYRNALKGGQAGGGGGGVPPEMAALGAVAAGEYLANREEAGDEARIAAMQGQSMALPGGAPPGTWAPGLLGPVKRS